LQIDISFEKMLAVYTSESVMVASFHPSASLKEAVENERASPTRRDFSRIKVFLHKPVIVPCQTCEGRAYTIDIVDHDKRRIVTRRACPSCKGQGTIDISRGPVTDDPEALAARLGLFH